MNRLCKETAEKAVFSFLGIFIHSLRDKKIYLFIDSHALSTLLYIIKRKLINIL